MFLASQCITLFGSTLVQMAIVWYVTLKTSAGVWVAVFTICAYLPQLLISFAGGVWADRHSRKQLSVYTDTRDKAKCSSALMLRNNTYNGQE